VLAADPVATRLLQSLPWSGCS